MLKRLKSVSMLPVSYTHLRFTYDYDNKYLFQYSANYNGSLSYSPDKRWGYFQAVSYTHLDVYKRQSLNWA